MTKVTNSIAEIRQQRKLESQRLEAELRKHQEAIQRQKEVLANALENERLAAEQQRLFEMDQARLRQETETLRAKSLEQSERKTILSIERKMKLIGAFCTSEMNLKSPLGLPVCAAMLTLSSLEKPIPSLSENVELVGDSQGQIHVYTRRGNKHLFTCALDASVYNAHHTPTSICTTRTGHLIVCQGKRHCINIYDFGQLVALYEIASSTGEDLPIIDASLAMVISYGVTNGQLVNPCGVCFDNTAHELYVSEQDRDCVQVFSVNLIPSHGIDQPPSISRNDSYSESSFTSIVYGSTQPPLMFSRRIGSKGQHEGQLHHPTGLDVSHYHILVCDTGNSRIVVFTKRGGFVCTYGSKGSSKGQFIDPRDVKLVNIRKKALVRGCAVEANTILNEQFDIIVADLGNFRVQILKENGSFIAVLSFLSSVEQINYQRELHSSIFVNLLREYLQLNEPNMPVVEGKDYSSLYHLSTKLHPSSKQYSYIVQQVAALREGYARVHNPRALCYDHVEKELFVVDQVNAIVATYKIDGTRSKWLNLPAASSSLGKTNPDGLRTTGLSSIHTCISSWIFIPDESSDEQRLFITDPQSHRIAVFRKSSLQFLMFIGATSYGDETLCSNGFLPGELRFPSYLAICEKSIVSTSTSNSLSTSPRLSTSQWLLVSDTGNHCVTVFDAAFGVFQGRIGYGFGREEGYFDSPQGIGVLNDRWLFVADQRNHRIQLFDLNTRQFCRLFGSTVNLSFPGALAVCSALPQSPGCDFGPHRGAKVIVGDTGSHRIFVFSLKDDGEGEQVLFILDKSLTPLQSPIFPTSIVIEARSNYVLVSDLNNKCVVVFRHDGTYLSTFDANLESEYQFQHPKTIALSVRKRAYNIEDVETSEVIVGDAVRHAICIFELSHDE